MLICSTVVIQQPDDPLGSVLEESRRSHRRGSGVAPFDLVHVVNPFSQPANESHTRTQHSTLVTMEQAATLEGAGVRQISVSTREDRGIAPNSFVRANDLDRTVLDVGSFAKPRPLPLLFDILDRAGTYAQPDDYLIYTNIDICLMPQFYRAIRDLISLGFDAIMVNRRTVSDVADYHVNHALAASEVGLNHPGFDCLIFRRALYSLFVRCNVCIGAPAVARALLYNMITHSRRTLMLKNVHLTYHLGNDQIWLEKSFADYHQFNIREVIGVMQQLARDPASLAILQEFCERHPEPERFAKVARSLTVVQ
jgi:hypothetical protein